MQSYWLSKRIRLFFLKNSLLVSETMADSGTRKLFFWRRHSWRILGERSILDKLKRFLWHIWGISTALSICWRAKFFNYQENVGTHFEEMRMKNRRLFLTKAIQDECGEEPASAIGKRGWTQTYRGQNARIFSSLLLAIQQKMINWNINRFMRFSSEEN